jgi:hypothetical protein
MAYTRPNHLFSPELYKECTQSQKTLLDSFKSKLYTDTPVKCIYQSYFRKGTLRITKPGIYVLKEHIIFNPITIFPTPEQSIEYPTGKDGPYHLGFFAAMTIECDDVIFDLNGYSIRQGSRHNILQRFFSIIELADSPFIPKQGPHDFISNIKSASNCLVMNGTLDDSSHHGIHGNTGYNVVLYNLIIKNFEVAGIALNGYTNSIISKCDLFGKRDNIKLLSSFSQALFTATMMVQLNETSNKIYKTLDEDIQSAYSEVLSHKKQSTYFENISLHSDANMYGIVLNVNGVVINEFLTERSNDTVGNEDITLFDISLQGVMSHPTEIIALPIEVSTNDATSSENAYGGKRMVGPFGAVFDIEKIMDEERKYKGNSLSDAQLYLAEYYPNKSTINISSTIIEWAKKGLSLPHTQSYVTQGDSMGHFMKGNIGLFISGGKNINVTNLTIEDVVTYGEDVGISTLLNDDERYTQGANAYGLLMTASKNVKLTDVFITDIVSQHPKGITNKIEIV